MFKQTYGFDTDILKRGMPVLISDSCPKMNYGVWYEGDTDYHNENMSGTYLIVDCNPSILTLLNLPKEKIEMPIKHFVGDHPRMKLTLYKVDEKSEGECR